MGFHHSAGAESSAVAPADRGKARRNDVALGIALVALAVLALRALFPLWLPLLMAAWFANLARPLSQSLERLLHGKRPAASLAAVLLVVVVLSPLAIVVLTLAGDAGQLVKSVLESESADAALRSIIASGDGARGLDASLAADPRRLFDLVRENGASAFGFASSVAGATLAIVIGLIVFVMGFYVFLLHGAAFGAWLGRNLPLTPRQYRRLSEAFYETGRGLIVGVGLTALAQGLIAGIGYVIVGVPRAFVLGLLTAAAALVPSVGSGLVWLPVAGVLALTGNIGGSIAILGVGAAAGLIDNFMRPVLSRFGRLRVPTFVLFCAMLGGVMAFGPSGLVAGPLFVRMTMEGLRLWRARSAPTLIQPS